MQENRAIKFRCPECQQLLRAHDESAGMTIECPSCSADLIVPNAAASDLLPAHKYSRLTDAQLEKKLESISDPKERDILMNELTDRFSAHYIGLLENESETKKRNKIFNDILKRLTGYYSVIRSFSARMIGYLSKDL